MCESIEDAATDQKLSTFVTLPPDLANNQTAHTERMLAQRVNGLILGGAHLDELFLDDLADMQYRAGRGWCVSSSLKANPISRRCEYAAAKSGALAWAGSKSVVSNRYRSDFSRTSSVV